MSETKPAGATGVVCESREGRAALEAYLAERGIGQAKWFTPGELHDLDREVRRGRIGRVIFAGLPDLLAGIWEEEIELGQWPAGVGLEFAAPPGDDVVRITAASWQQWRKRHRRRQALAGAILSAIVLAVAFGLCVLLAR